MASSFLYQKVVQNKYLGTLIEIKANSLWELDTKEKEVLKKWEKQEAAKRERERISDLKDKAELMNLQAEIKIDELKSILTYTLNVDDKLDWDAQHKKEPFPAFQFSKVVPIKESFFVDVPQKRFWEYIFPSIEVKRINAEKLAQGKYEKAIFEFESEKEVAYQKYMSEKNEFDSKQKEHNDQIQQWKSSFENGDPESIERYIGVVLGNSKYPEEFDSNYEVQYDIASKTVIVSYYLPSTENVADIIGYKYIASSKSIKPITMKKKEYEAFYEDVIMQITLRTIHEIFESVYTEHVQSIVFNGWINGIDKADGQDFTSCIISLQANRDEFDKINLSRIELKSCVRQLKGITAGPLIQLAPVRPIMSINREDRRFIESKEVLAGINSTTNLATIDWEDFEHLVRELFAKIFSKDNAEVNVTQASRDGGVDAIAFDPDPIRGGKFVIQAKRYNNVVPVSAVRDLYGTMINEGAVKGILVTTSYYGNDSRDFVKDKPITLIDGSNLVHMFQEYGHNVRIDLKKGAIK